ncbi:gluconate 2-dehydrogenase subunit 3 family protein [Mucilaginibacter sp. OK098]|uniref:gluconate 2-dehydrogenase subunit 3 family protein n=1 Tax=Mucilaginibacter sp. OK098 TaxID=1855297 RepID=UPI0009111583|nr:gluconate 2-dehydrogenase subunit 3 family protein [Mucilaginibacter sp. OK098]SHN28172.1 Gluconate 2-dehydrogenase subunit 3 [Mucilaginibacter sp. OK098]
MNRRDAIGRVALLMGGAVIGAEFFISGCKSGAGKVEDLFVADNIAFLNEVADTILPTTTSSPGAKAANVGHFMALMVQDCYWPKNQKTFLEGISKLDDASQKKFSSKFMSLTAQQKTDLLVDLDKEQKEYTKKNANSEMEDSKHRNDPDFKGPTVAPHYFRMMKELTLLGYFTSEIGATKALRYIAVPGHYDGNVPYKKGDKAWAT